MSGLAFASAPRPSLPMRFLVAALAWGAVAGLWLAWQGEIALRVDGACQNGRKAICRFDQRIAEPFLPAGGEKHIRQMIIRGDILARGEQYDPLRQFGEVELGADLCTHLFTTRRERNTQIDRL